MTEIKDATEARIREDERELCIAALTKYADSYVLRYILQNESKDGKQTMTVVEAKAVAWEIVLAGNSLKELSKEGYRYNIRR